MAPQLLIVEDDADSGEMLALLFESYGFGVTIADRNRLARAEIERTGFDLVIADLMVDSMDPAVSWKHLDELIALARPSPIALLTSWPIQPEQIRERELAFAAAKPCTSETLLSLVGRALALPPLAPAQERAIRSYFEHIENRDFAALAAACTSDVVYRMPSGGEVIVGRDAFRDHSIATFDRYRDVQFEISEIRPLPRGAIARYTSRWRDGDKLLAMTAAVLFVLEDLLIAEIGVRIDLARAHEQAA